MKHFIATLAVINVLIVAALFVKVAAVQTMPAVSTNEPAPTVYKSKSVHRDSNRIVKTQVRIYEPETVRTRVRIAD